jgi:HSP20 family molecular chaperone IbpA
MEDMFDEIRKLIRHPFRGIIDDDLFGTDWAARLEEEMKDWDKPKQKNGKSAKSYSNSKSYSISYRYGTGMKEPEIRIEGDVDKDTVDRFLSGISHQFDHAILPDLNKTHLLKPTIERTQEDAEDGGVDGGNVKIPFSDVQDHGKSATVMLEMPGIGKEDVKVGIKGHDVNVTATNSDIKYHKTFKLNFKPSDDFEITATNGIISIELKKK